MKISALVFETNLKGVRVSVAKRRFDINWAAAQQYGLTKADIKTQIKLIEDGDMLITQEEKTKGTLVEEASESPTLLRAIFGKSEISIEDLLVGVGVAKVIGKMQDPATFENMEQEKVYEMAEAMAVNQLKEQGRGYFVTDQALRQAAESKDAAAIRKEMVEDLGDAVTDAALVNAAKRGIAGIMSLLMGQMKDLAEQLASEDE